MDSQEKTNINDERKIRLKKMEELRAAGIDPYPAESNRKHTLQQALVGKDGEKFTVAGRILTKREMGKLTFCHLQDESSRMQIARKKDDGEKKNYNLFTKKIDIGDIIEIEGEKFLTHKGEQIVFFFSDIVLFKRN